MSEEKSLSIVDNDPSLVTQSQILYYNDFFCHQFQNDATPFRNIFDRVNVIEMLINKN